MRVGRSSGGAMAVWGRGLGAWLGIAVLLLQLLVAANHFHPEDFAAPTRDPGLHAPAGLAPGVPLQPGAPGHDDCGQCFTLQLVASSTLAAPPPLPAPSALGLLRALPERDYHVASAPFLLFQTRAPPTL